MRLRTEVRLTKQIFMRLGCVRFVIVLICKVTPSTISVALQSQMFILFRAVTHVADYSNRKISFFALLWYAVIVCLVYRRCQQQRWASVLGLEFGARSAICRITGLIFFQVFVLCSTIGLSDLKEVSYLFDWERAPD
jgi:hypothetical protein